MVYSILEVDIGTEFLVSSISFQVVLKTSSSPLEEEEELILSFSVCFQTTLTLKRDAACLSYVISDTSYHVQDGDWSG